MTDTIVKEKRSGPSEDVWAVVIGSLIILSVLAAAFIWPAYKFSAPAYGWDDWESLSAKVLTLKNVLLLAGIGFVLLLLAATAVHFGGASVRGF
ncbi:MAG TPA: hypothetical protein VM871_05780, partial [Flavisolibacter sp.]|nr:hypothetical protein [Flavisolibacter sp.]